MAVEPAGSAKGAAGRIHSLCSDASREGVPLASEDIRSSEKSQRRRGSVGGAVSPTFQRVVCPEGRQDYRRVNPTRLVLTVLLPPTPSHVVRPYSLTGARRPHLGTSAWVTTAPHGILLGALVCRGAR